MSLLCPQQISLRKKKIVKIVRPCTGTPDIHKNAGFAQGKTGGIAYTGNMRLAKGTPMSA